MSKLERRVALARLAAELRQERDAIAHTVADAAALRAGADSAEASLLRKYAAGAVLHAFYTGVEKFFLRLAPQLNGGTPEGPSWHRQLLDNMALALPDIRPPVISADCARSLAPFLGFRHRFRNLYAFDLEWAKLVELLDALPPTWAGLEPELGAFIAWLESAAAALGPTE